MEILKFSTAQRKTSKSCLSLKKFILGDTDSELIFFILLSFVAEKIDLDSSAFDLEKLVRIIRFAIDQIINIVGPYSQIDNAGESETYLTFILSNGDTMLAYRGGKDLHYSTYKNKCRCSNL